jgi:hypothetical protein
MWKDKVAPIDDLDGLPSTIKSDVLMLKGASRALRELQGMKDCTLKSAITQDLENLFNRDSSVASAHTSLLDKNSKLETELVSLSNQISVLNDRNDAMSRSLSRYPSRLLWLVIGIIVGVILYSQHNRFIPWDAAIPEEKVVPSLKR